MTAATAKKSPNLTPKQETFVGEVIAGKGPSEAYRCAYNAGGMSDKAVSVEAARLQRNPSVALAIAEAVAQARERACWGRAESMARLRIATDDLLERLVGSDDAQDAAKLAQALAQLMARLDELAGVDVETKALRTAMTDAVTYQAPVPGFSMDITETRYLPWPEARAALDAISAGKDPDISDTKKRG